MILSRHFTDYARPSCYKSAPLVFREQRDLYFGAVAKQAKQTMDCQRNRLVDRISATDKLQPFRISRMPDDPFMQAILGLSAKGRRYRSDLPLADPYRTGSGSAALAPPCD